MSERSIHISENCREKELSFKTFIEGDEIHQATIIKKKIGTVAQLASKLLPEPPVCINSLFSSSEFGENTLSIPSPIDAVFTKDQHVFSTDISLRDLNISQNLGISWLRVRKPELARAEVRDKLCNTVMINGYTAEAKGELIDWVNSREEISHLYLPVAIGIQGGYATYLEQLNMTPEIYELQAYSQIKPKFNRHAVLDHCYRMTMLGYPTGDVNRYLGAVYLYQENTKGEIQTAHLPNVYDSCNVCMGSDFTRNNVGSRTNSLLKDLKRVVSYFLESEFNADLWDNKAQTTEFIFVEREENGDIFQAIDYSDDIPKTMLQPTTSSADKIPATIVDAHMLAKADGHSTTSIRRIR